MTNYRLGPDINLDTEIVLDKAGNRITESRAEEIAQEVLRQVRGGDESLSDSK